MATGNALSTFAANKVLNILFNGETYSIPNVYMALFTDGTGLSTGQLTGELSGDNYGRVNITANGGFTVPSEGTTRNAALLEFPTASENWGVVTHAAIVDAATEGNVIAYGELAEPQPVYKGVNFQFAPENVIIRIYEQAPA